MMIKATVTPAATPTPAAAPSEWPDSVQDCRPTTGHVYAGRSAVATGVASKEIWEGELSAVAEVAVGGMVVRVVMMRFVGLLS